MLWNRPAFGILTWVALYGAGFFLLSVQLQLALVARETTLVNVSTAPLTTMTTTIAAERHH